MKNNISILLKRGILVVLALAITFLSVFVNTVSASAEEYDTSSGWYDILDYTTLTETGNFLVSDKESIVFNVRTPIQSKFTYVDMICEIVGSHGGEITDLRSTFGWPDTGAYTYLEFLHIGDNLYRVYGNVPGGNYGSFNLQFVNRSPYIYYINVLSLRLRNLTSSTFLDTGKVRVSVPGLTDRTFSMRSPGNKLDVSIVNEDTQATFSFRTENWRKYDYIEFLITLNVDSIGSIVCDNGADGIFPVNVSEIVSTDGSKTSFLVGVDLTGVDRSDDFLAPEVAIQVYGTGLLQLTLHDVVGHINIDPPSPEVHWWTKLFDTLNTWFSRLGSWLSSGFDSVVNAIKGIVVGTPEQQDKVDSAVDRIEDQADKVGGLIDQASPPKPDLSTGALDRAEVIPNAGVSILTAVISPIVNNELVISILCMVATLMLVGYVLFGKKG